MVNSTGGATLTESKLSTTGFKISSTTIPATTTTTGSVAEQFTFDGRVDELQSTGSGHLPSQTIANPKGNVSTVSLRNGRELPQQPAPQPKMKPIYIESESEADSLRVEINIPLLNVIKQIPKYAKFLKELCMHKRKKMKGGVEMGGVVSALIKSEEVAAIMQQAMPKKC
ncbi:hypothetical protein CR513_03873, partial [Mucuna pruriens]